MKLGLCINRIADIPAVKRAGFDGYEFSGSKLAAFSAAELAQMKQISDQEHFPCLGINAYSAGEPAFIGENYSAKKLEEYGKRVCERGAWIGAKNIGIGAPKARMLTGGFVRSEADKQMKEFLEITAGIARAYQQNVLLEPLQRHICNYINTTAEAMAFIRDAKQKNLKLVFDFYHVAKEEADWRNRFGEIVAYIGHVHVSTSLGDTERGYPIQKDRAEYQEIFDVMTKAGYAKAVSVEPGLFDAQMAAESAKMMRGLEEMQI